MVTVVELVSRSSEIGAYEPVKFRPYVPTAQEYVFNEIAATSAPAGGSRLFPTVSPFLRESLIAEYGAPESYREEINLQRASVPSVAPAYLPPPIALPPAYLRTFEEARGAGYELGPELESPVEGPIGPAPAAVEYVPGTGEE